VVMWRRLAESGRTTTQSLGTIVAAAAAAGVEKITNCVD